MVVMDIDARERWWAAVICRDGPNGDSERSLLQCVLCDRDTDPASQDRGAMLAWWMAPAGVIVAAGLYCAGRDRCLTAAEMPGMLLDRHAYQALGGKALREAERISAIYRHWDGSALRRLVLVCFQLARVSAAKPKPASLEDAAWARAEAEWDESDYLARTDVDGS